MAASKGLTQVTQVGRRNSSSSAQGSHSNLVWSNLHLTPLHALSGPPWRSQTLPSLFRLCITDSHKIELQLLKEALQVRSDPPAEQLSLKFDSLHKACSRLPSFTPFFSSAPLKTNSRVLSILGFCQVCLTKKTITFSRQFFNTNKRDIAEIWTCSPLIIPC